MREEAQRKVTMTVFLCLCIQLIAFMPPNPTPSERKLFIWFVKSDTQRDEMVARQSQGCEHMPSVFTGADLAGMEF